MGTFRRAITTALCSAMLVLASVPSVATADMLPEIDFPEDVPRLAMPRIDESRLVDDGSLYYEVITEANESGDPARSADYAYGAIEVDDESGIDAWVPVRRSDGADGEPVYDETWALYMSCEVSIAEVPEELREPPSSMFDPITIQLLDEDGNLIEDRVPMDAEEALDGPEVDRTFRFGGGHVITIPTGWYTLRVTESRPKGDFTREIAFRVDESKDFVIDESKVVGEGWNEHKDDTHRRQLCQWDYPSGAVFTADMWVEPAEVKHEHTEVLYDPTEEDEEFTAGLAKQFPDGFTAGEAEHAWTNLLYSRAYKELNPTPAGGSDARHPLPSGTGISDGSGNDASLGIVIAISVAVVLAGTIVTLVVVTRRKGVGSSTTDPDFDDGRHDAR